MHAEARLNESAKVPRDPTNDYSAEMAQRRRDFVRERTGTALDHVGRYFV